jgi:glycosyltransferase involved in cell wall biosynthesis
MTDETRPLVSICIPTRNAERWIGGAIESALAQTWSELELVIADNASSDLTLPVARSFSDPRVRIEANPVDVGAIRNHNRTIDLARGAYVKFLHADDTLAPTCVEEMVTLAMEDPRMGLVFSRRDVLVEGDDTAWATTYAAPHESFSSLERDNNGRRLFRELLDACFEHNWIGEPSAVMVTRRALEVSGLFNIHLRQRADLDLWARIMIAHRVGFIDKPLCVYRHHSGSVTATNQSLGRDWLDRLWLFESILGSPGLEPAERRKLEGLRRAALRRAARSQVRRLVSGRFDLQLAAYARHRVGATITSLQR